MELTMRDISPEESLIEYPSAFPIKVMGANADGFAEAVMAHLDAERGDLGEPGEIRRCASTRGTLRRRAPLENGMTARIGEADVHARRTGDAMACDVEGLERSQGRLLEPVDVFLDMQPEPSQVDQRISDRLAGAVVGHLPAAIRLQHRNRPGVENVCSTSCDAERVDRPVFAEPDLVRRVAVARRRVGAHRRNRLGAVDEPEPAQVRTGHRRVRAASGFIRPLWRDARAPAGTRNCPS
jgi:hypothetical protein